MCKLKNDAKIYYYYYYYILERFSRMQDLKGNLQDETQLKKKKSWLQNKVKEVQKACKELEIDYKDFSACIASNRTSKQSLSCICIFYCFSTAMPAPSLSFVLLLYSTASFLGFSLYMYLLLLFYSCFLSLCTPLFISLWLLPSPFLVFLMFFSLSFSFLAAKVSCTYCLLPLSFFVALV